MTHTFFMQHCIKLAYTAKENGESPIGSIVVLNGEIIGEGIEASKVYRDITFHAEIEAIRNATKYLNSQSLADCILYTTHEPCIMCSYVIRHVKINTIIMGVLSGEVGGSSSVYPLLKDASIQKWGNPPQLISGILENECKALHN